MPIPRHISNIMSIESYYMHSFYYDFINTCNSFCCKTPLYLVGDECEFRSNLNINIINVKNILYGNANIKMAASISRFQYLNMVHLFIRCCFEETNEVIYYIIFDFAEFKLKDNKCQSKGSAKI